MTWNQWAAGASCQWRQDCLGLAAVPTYDHHTAPGVQAIHERQQRAHDAVVDLVLLAAPHLQTQDPQPLPMLTLQHSAARGFDFCIRRHCPLKCLLA